MQPPPEPPPPSHLAGPQVRCHCIECVEADSQQRRPHDSCAATAVPSPIVILFSGGVDSVLLAALAHRCGGMLTLGVTAMSTITAT